MLHPTFKYRQVKQGLGSNARSGDYYVEPVHENGAYFL